MAFVSFDYNSKTEEYIDIDYIDIGDCPPEKKAFNIGDLALSFLELDFSEFEKYRQRAENIITVYSHTNMFETEVKNFSKNATLQSNDFFDPNPDNDKLKKILAQSVYSYFVDMVLPLNHMYFSDSQIIGSAEEYIKSESNFVLMQNELSEAIEFCLNIDNHPLNHLNSIQRYFIYQKSYRNKIGRVDQIRSEIHFDHKIRDIYPLLYKRESGSQIIIKPITDELIETVSNNNFFITEGYNIHSVRQSMLLEFIKMIQCGVKIRKCKNCGKYFIIKGNYNAEYCQRILPGETSTCHQIGTSKKYQSKVAGNPVLREYTRAYKRYFSRFRNKRMAPSEFEKWSYEAKEMRGKALNNEISLEKFKDWLGNK